VREKHKELVGKVKVKDQVIRGVVDKDCETEEFPLIFELICVLSFNNLH